MADQKTLQGIGSSGAPAMIPAQLFGEFSGTEFLQQVGQRLAEVCGFPCHLGADDHEKDHDQRQQQRVDQCDGASTPAECFLQVIYQWTHEIGKEDGKQEGDQGCTGDVKKAQAERKQQHCNQDPSRA